MNKCFDSNKTELNIGDGVMCLSNGRECEGIIVELLSNNKVLIDGEAGSFTIDASEVFYLP